MYQSIILDFQTSVVKGTCKRILIGKIQKKGKIENTDNGQQIPYQSKIKNPLGIIKNICNEHVIILIVIGTRMIRSADTGTPNQEKREVPFKFKPDHIEPEILSLQQLKNYLAVKGLIRVTCINIISILHSVHICTG